MRKRKAIEVLRVALEELRLHNEEYHHNTPVSVFVAIEEVIAAILTCGLGEHMVSATYVKAEVDRAMQQLQDCSQALRDVSDDLPTKAISLATGAVKNASTLLGILKDLKKEAKETASNG